MTSVDRHSRSRLGRPLARRSRRAALRECFPAVADTVPRARRRLAAFAAGVGADLDQIDEIRLACSEALSNVVQHAYLDGSGRIEVAAWIVPGELWILIGDDGCGLHADRESPGLGLGLALMSQVSDGFVVMERSCGGTEVRLRFELDGVEDSGGGSVSRVSFLR